MSASVKARLAAATDPIASSSVPRSQSQRSRMRDLSRWIWLSTKPAITRRPSSCSAGASAAMRSPMSTMRPSAMTISTSGSLALARRACRNTRSTAMAGTLDSDLCFCSELDVEFFQFVGLGFGAGNPFLHERQCHDGLAIGGALRIELYVVGEKAGDHGRVHRVSHARLLPEQIRPMGVGETFTPDADDTIDIGLGARPNLEAGIMGFEVHRQRRAQIAEPRMHFTRDRTTAGARCTIERHVLGAGIELVEIFRDGERVP